MSAYCQIGGSYNRGGPLLERGWLWLEKQVMCHIIIIPFLCDPSDKRHDSSKYVMSYQLRGPWIRDHPSYVSMQGAGGVTERGYSGSKFMCSLESMALGHIRGGRPCTLHNIVKFRLLMLCKLSNTYSLQTDSLNPLTGVTKGRPKRNMMTHNVTMTHSRLFLR